MKLYYKDMSVQKIEEVKEFPSFINVLNSLGGALSLWLGISFIAIFEVVELMFRFVHAMCINMKP